MVELILRTLLLDSYIKRSYDLCKSWICKVTRTHVALIPPPPPKILLSYLQCLTFIKGKDNILIKILLANLSTYSKRFTMYTIIVIIQLKTWNQTNDFIHFYSFVNFWSVKKFPITKTVKNWQPDYKKLNRKHKMDTDKSSESSSLKSLTSKSKSKSHWSHLC